MARSSKQKYRPGIDDRPEPVWVKRWVFWAVAESIRLLTVVLRRRPR
jgi:hypothetical protein